MEFSRGKVRNAIAYGKKVQRENGSGIFVMIMEDQSTSSLEYRFPVHRLKNFFALFPHYRTSILWWLSDAIYRTFNSHRECQVGFLPSITIMYKVKAGSLVGLSL